MPNGIKAYLENHHHLSELQWIAHNRSHLQQKTLIAEQPYGEIFCDVSAVSLFHQYMILFSLDLEVLAHFRKVDILSCDFAPEVSMKLYARSMTQST